MEVARLQLLRVLRVGYICTRFFLLRRSALADYIEREMARYPCQG